MKIRPVKNELLHACGRTDEQTDRQTDRYDEAYSHFRNFAKGPQKITEFFGVAMTSWTCTREYEFWPSDAHSDLGFR